MKGKYLSGLVSGLIVGVIAGAGGLNVFQSRARPWDENQRRGNDRQADHEHAEHDEEPMPGAIRLTAEAIREAGIEVAEATGGVLRQTLSLTGEVVLNSDRLAHIVPRVDGIVREVRNRLGDYVQPGEIMAVLESRELAEAKAAYLAAKQRRSLAQANLAANRELKATGVVPELDFLAARRALAEAEIEVRAAENTLHTLGVTAAELPLIEDQDDESFATYELRAPFGGSIIEKHITLGEIVGPDSDVFELADLSDVWVNLAVYQKDLPDVRVGQSTVIIAGEGIAEASGVIDYVSAVVAEGTRTAVARLTLPNADGRWRPGLFVTGRIVVQSIKAEVFVPKTALQSIEGQTCVFVESDEGFELRPVTIGRSDDTNVEVTAGLKPGERFVTANAFTLKSELAKAGFEAGHAH